MHIGNRYQLGKEIGAGDMGTVYLGTDTLTRQTCNTQLLLNDYKSRANL
jgi:serine/threonine protein kinase